VGLPPGFSSGTSALYLYVDSWNPGVAVGAVDESDETNNRFSKTGFGPLGLTSAAEQGSVWAPQPTDLTIWLPRPAQPGREGE
jgi:hypothetical protein